MGDRLWTLPHVFGFLTGKVHSHHPHTEIEDEDLENALIENCEDEVELLDEYEDNNEHPVFEEMDEQLADPRADPRPKPWRWLRRVSVSCTVKCGRYNWCRLRTKNKQCTYPRGCNCTRFAWQGK